jgi:TolA-binding protein
MTPTAARAKATLALVCAGALPACIGPSRGAGYTAALAAGEEAVEHARFDDAAARFDEAARTAKVPRDAAHARYLAARALASAGNAADAATRLRAIADASPPAEDSATAAYAICEMSVARGDDAAWPCLLDVAKRFPSSGVARPALRHLVAHEDEVHGPRATLDDLAKLAPTFVSTDLAETVAYESALHLQMLGEDARARDAFVAMARRWHYPEGVFWDDALYRASELAEKLGDYAQATSLLTEMLGERESSWLIGSYERPRYEAAMVRLCALARDRLHDRARARSCFDTLYRTFAHSELRDDALWEEARLFREDGDRAASCTTLEKLVGDFPDSRYVPCAIDECATIARPDAGAPRTCHPYLATVRLGAQAKPTDGEDARDAGAPPPRADSR